MYYRDASAALLIYDISNKASFDSVKLWVDDLREKAPRNIVLGVVGNKCDLED